MNNLKLLRRLIKLTLLALVLVGCVVPVPTPAAETPTATMTPEVAVATPTLIPPTSTAASSVAEAMPGLGVPVVGGNWEVTIKAANEKRLLESLQGDSYSPASDFTFVVLHIMFRNLDSSQETKITGDEFTIINSDGDSIKLIGGGDPYRDNSYSVSETASFAYTNSERNTLELALVFAVKKETVSQVFNFQFKDVPLIPFTVEVK